MISASCSNCPLLRYTRVITCFMNNELDFHMTLKVLSVSVADGARPEEPESVCAARVWRSHWSASESQRGVGPSFLPGVATDPNTLLFLSHFFIVPFLFLWLRKRNTISEKKILMCESVTESQIENCSPVKNLREVLVVAHVRSLNCKCS